MPAMPGHLPLPLPFTEKTPSTPGHFPLPFTLPVLPPRHAFTRTGSGSGAHRATNLAQDEADDKVENEQLAEETAEAEAFKKAIELDKGRQQGMGNNPDEDAVRTAKHARAQGAEVAGMRPGLLSRRPRQTTP